MLGVGDGEERGRKKEGSGGEVYVCMFGGWMRALGCLLIL